MNARSPSMMKTEQPCQGLEPWQGYFHRRNSVFQKNRFLSQNILLATCVTCGKLVKQFLRVAVAF